MPTAGVEVLIIPVWKDNWDSVARHRRWNGSQKERNKADWRDAVLSDLFEAEVVSRCLTSLSVRDRMFARAAPTVSSQDPSPTPTSLDQLSASVRASRMIDHGSNLRTA
jgi:hypothetical protein